MITVYEIKSNGFIGTSKEIDPKAGIGTGWTYTAPPDEGSYKWEHSQWVAMDEPPVSIAGPDLDALAKDAREKRNTLLAKTDWTQLSDSSADKEKYAAYRQALRDITEQNGFPLEVVWPEKL